MTDEKNVGTYIEVDGKEGGPETTMAREEAMRREVIDNDPGDMAGVGMDMTPADDNGVAYMDYEHDVEDPARPVEGAAPRGTLAEDALPEPAAEAAVAAQAQARAVASQPPIDVSSYDMASTISSMEDAERNFEAMANGDMEGEAFPRTLIFSGSSTFAPLMQALVDGFSRKFGNWKAVHPSLPMAKIDITVRPCSTPQGIQDVLAGEADFAMASCPVPYETFEKFGEFREAFEIAHGLLALGVSVDNTLPEDTLGGLSRDDYRRIFSGHALTWNDVDAALPQEDIKLFVGADDCGTRAVFDEVIMKGSAVAASAQRLDVSRDLAPALAKEPWAIGYAPLQDIDAINAQGMKIVALKVDGNEPNGETVANGRYPLSCPFTIMAARRADPFIRVLLKYVFSQEGYDIVRARGCYPSFKPGDTKQVYVTEPL